MGGSPPGMDFLATHEKKVRVSICDPRERGEEERSTSRKDSILVPALDFARRMSMKLTGGAGRLAKAPSMPEVTPVRRRARRAPRQREEERLGRRKSLFEPVGSRKAQLSIDIDKGVVLLREEKPQGLGLLTQGLRRLAQLVGFPLPEEDLQQAETEPVCVQQVDAPRRYRPVDIAELCAATGWVKAWNSNQGKQGKLFV